MSYNQTDFVKDRVAVEVQFGKYAFVAHDLFVKHLSFYASDVIDVCRTTSEICSTFCGKGAVSLRCRSSGWASCHDRHCSDIAPPSRARSAGEFCEALGHVGQDDVGTRSLDGGQVLKRDRRAVNPTVGGGGGPHGVLTADVVGGQRHL